MFGRTELSVKALVQRAGPKFSGKDQIFQKKLVRGTKIFSEKIGPGTKIFRTKIQVTNLYHCDRGKWPSRKMASLLSRSY